MGKLFEICQYYISHPNNNILKVQIYENKYTKTCVDIDLPHFNAYLERNDLMLNDAMQKVSLDEYLDTFHPEMVKEDIYHYICAYHCDYGHAMDATLQNINSILNKFFI